MLLRAGQSTARIGRLEKGCILTHSHKPHHDTESHVRMILHTRLIRLVEGARCSTTATRTSVLAMRLVRAAVVDCFLIDELQVNSILGS